MKNKNLLKLLFFFLSLGLLWLNFSRKEHLSWDWFGFFSNQLKEAYPYLILVVLLIPVNWFLEALKWKYLVRKIEHITLFSALGAVLSGLSFGMITPHGLGDYPARIWSLEKENRNTALGAVAVSRLTQLFVTIVAGILSVAIILGFGFLKKLYLEIFIVVFFAALLLVVLVFYKKLVNLLIHQPWMRRFQSYFDIIESYNKSEIRYVLFLSLLRYIVFSSQFVLVLLFYEVHPGVFWLYTGVAFVFLMKSILPTILDLGIRETFAVLFFCAMMQDEQMTIYASISLWMFNLFIPSMIGVLFIWRWNITLTDK